MWQNIHPFSYQREKEGNDEDICRQDDDIHGQAHLQEIRKMVAARAIDEHVARRTDGRGKAAGNRYHERHAEAERVSPHSQRAAVGNREEDGCRCGIGIMLLGEPCRTGL